MNIKKEIFGQGLKGEKVFLYTLINPNGVTIRITNYGAIITSIEMADKNGEKENIALGFKTLEEYLSSDYLANYPYFGAVCGRYCNRIAGGKFDLEGLTYQLNINNGPNSLHGGKVGFDKMIWSPKTIEMPDFVGLELKYRSVHLEENYPGNLDVTILYKLTHKNELQIEYKAVTDRATVVNLTNHTYFNLSGGKENVFNHQLLVNSKKRTVNDATLIPTGEIADVTNTPYDFSVTKSVGSEISSLPDGYDLNYVLDNADKRMVFAAKLFEAESGRSVSVFTTEPAIQLYTGYWIPQIGDRFGSYSGMALETQHYPDSPNHAEFPTTVLLPGEVYKSKTTYIFETNKL
jgi:aldose 1-epimerase